MKSGENRQKVVECGAKTMYNDIESKYVYIVTSEIITLPVDSFTKEYWVV